jgi:hypothetical protein
MRLMTLPLRNVNNSWYPKRSHEVRSPIGASTLLAGRLSRLTFCASRVSRVIRSTQERRVLDLALRSMLTVIGARMPRPGWLEKYMRRRAWQRPRPGT